MTDVGDYGNDGHGWRKVAGTFPLEARPVSRSFRRRPPGCHRKIGDVIYTGAELGREHPIQTIGASTAFAAAPVVRTAPTASVSNAAPDLEQVLLPWRDGLTLVRKLG